MPKPQFKWSLFVMILSLCFAAFGTWSAMRARAAAHAALNVTCSVISQSPESLRAGEMNSFRQTFDETCDGNKAIRPIAGLSGNSSVSEEVLDAQHVRPISDLEAKYFVAWEVEEQANVHNPLAETLEHVDSVDLLTPGIALARYTRVSKRAHETTIEKGAVKVGYAFIPEFCTDGDADDRHQCEKRVLKNPLGFTLLFQTEVGITPH